MIKPLITRLHREFNISVAEVGNQDHWQRADLGCCIATTDDGYAHKALQDVINFVERSFPEYSIIEFHIEVIH